MLRSLFLITALLAAQLTFADDPAPPEQSDHDITATLRDRVLRLEARVTELEAERIRQLPGRSVAKPSLLNATTSEAAEPTDAEVIQGFWQANSVEMDGQALSGPRLDNVRFLFESDRVTIYKGGERTGAYRFSLDSNHSVPEVDFVSADTSSSGASKKGIYRLQGDTLELCFGRSRPSQFRGVDGADSFTLRRPSPGEVTAVPAWCLDVAPNGQQLAVAGGERDGRGIVTLLDAKDWSVALSHAEQRAATCVAYSPAGDKLAIGTQIGEVAILDMNTRAVENRWHTGKWAVFGITWTPDSQDVIAACANGIIKRFCADCGSTRMTFNTWRADGTLNLKLGGHADRNLWDVVVSRDGETLLSGGWHGTTRLWNMTTGSQKQAFSDLEHSTQGVKFLPDQRHFVSNGIRSAGTIVRATDSYEILAALDAAGRDVAVHPDGRRIAASTFEDVRVFRLDLAEPNDEQRAEIRKLVDQLSDADKDTSTAAAEELRSIGLAAHRILQEAGRTAKRELPERIKEICNDIKSPKPIATLDGHQGEVRQVVISPTGNFIATSTITGDVRIWDPESYQLQHDTTLELKP